MNVTNLLDWYDNLKNHEITIKARDLRTEKAKNAGYFPQREYRWTMIFPDSGIDLHGLGKKKK